MRNERLWLGLAGFVWLGLASLLAVFSLAAAAVGVPVFAVFGPMAVAMTGLGLSLLVPGSHARLLGWLSLISACAFTGLIALGISRTSPDFLTMTWWTLYAAGVAVVCSFLGLVAGWKPR
jgi:hypothetical protein